ncbi:hypothetical protein B0H16DRAFT_1688673 [Mycena metata]|uniref:DUF6534 domain-containing protein n=1 Tax=Mycena metata TaxID=1033252 RepID=A0AAD7JBC4_9AGAR|nr:hypothetical protein B0H16DRAFT_1688673 [Mycena metata]
MITASSVGPAVDGLIAVSMCFCLWRLRRSGVKRTQRMVDTLIVWTVETTLITSSWHAQTYPSWLSFSPNPNYSLIRCLHRKSRLATDCHLISHTIECRRLNGRQRFRLLDQGEVVSLELADDPERTKNRALMQLSAFSLETSELEQ